MTDTQRFDNLVLGSGEAGKYLAWTLAKAGQRSAVVERALIGGSCPNIACLPSKNIIHSGQVAALFRRGAEFGISSGPVSVDMEGVRRRKRRMVDELVAIHRGRYEASGAELIIGEGRLVAPKTIEVRYPDGRTGLLAGERVFLNVHAHDEAAHPSGCVGRRAGPDLHGRQRRRLGRRPHAQAALVPRPCLHQARV